MLGSSRSAFLIPSLLVLTGFAGGPFCPARLGPAGTDSTYADGTQAEGAPCTEAADCEDSNICRGNLCVKEQPGNNTSGGTSSSRDTVGAGCTETCGYAGDGTCDDGGDGSETAACLLGTDCRDCGDRRPPGWMGSSSGGGSSSSGASGTLGSCTNRNDGVCIQYLEDAANTATAADTRAQCDTEDGIYGTSCTPQAGLPTCRATLSVNGGKRVKAVVYWSEEFCANYSSDQVCAQYGGVPSGTCP